MIGGQKEMIHLRVLFWLANLFFLWMWLTVAQSYNPQSQSCQLRTTQSHSGLPKETSNERFSDAKANIDPPYGVYNWSETEVGMNDTNVYVYNTAEELGIARRCANPEQWDVYYGGQCITRNTFLIQTLIEQPITAENIDIIVGELSSIVSQISNPADQSPENLEVIATVFSSASSLIASGNISVSDTVSLSIKLFSSESDLVAYGKFVYHLYRFTFIME